LEYYIAQIINGLAQGSIYALMAIGYSVVVGVVGLVTFTHGEVIMLGAYASYYAFTYCRQQPAAGDCLRAFLLPGLLGFLCIRSVMNGFLIRRRHISLICTIGMSMLLKNLAQIFFGPNMKAMPQPIALRFINLFGVRINTIQIIIVVIVLALSLGLYIVNNKTQMGYPAAGRSARTKRRLR
jgi:branched-chain amino acid transport system permease protein